MIKAGFSKMNITSMRGVPIAGYYIERLQEGVLDELYIRALALDADGKKLLLISTDNLSIMTKTMDEFRENISIATGVNKEAIFIHCTHTHTAPYVDVERAAKFGTCDTEKTMQLIKEYKAFFSNRIVDASLSALEDCKPVKIGYAVSNVSNVAFLRRYRMKDGSVQTNPGTNNPGIVEPVGELDNRVSVVRFDREDGESFALINFANHADVIGGNKASADWPGFLCSTVEKALDNTKCIFFNGAEGDVNHINVHPTKGYMNDLTMDFDDVERGYGHARYIGRAVAGAVLQVWDKVEYVDADDIKFCEKKISVPSNMPKKSEMADARRINELHEAGRDDELPYKGMMLTTMVADAVRKLRLENGPEEFPMKLIAVSVGKIAFVGIPGEPFNRIGREIKEANGWDLIIPCCLVNGVEGYFPMKDSYDEGGYEARSSVFKAGVAELIIKESKAILDSML